jgi:hypothetical protein
MNTVLPAFHPSVWIERLGPSKRLADLLEERTDGTDESLHRKSVGGIEPPDIRELNSNAHQRDFVAGFHFSG